MLVNEKLLGLSWEEHHIAVQENLTFFITLSIKVPSDLISHQWMVLVLSHLFVPE